MPFIRAWLTALALLALAACAAPREQTPGDPSTRPVYVVRHGWHTGLVLRVADLTAAGLPGLGDFETADHIEVGWGDREYYPATAPTTWMGVQALLWPTPSALHLVGFRGAPHAYFPASEIVELALSREGFERLNARLRASFELDAEGKPLPLGRGLYGDSRFYASREAFHLFKTCNVWTARVLREAGVGVTPAFAFTPGGLLRQLRRGGEP